MKVYLFGCRDLGGIPECIEEHLVKMIEATNGDIEFMVSDGAGIDASFHKSLSAIGARDKSKVYCFEKPRSNVYELDTHVMNLKYDDDSKEVMVYDGDELVGELFDMTKLEDAYLNPQLYDIKSKRMVEICDFALCYTDGNSRNVQREIDRLSAYNKYVYVYTALI